MTRMYLNTLMSHLSFVNHIPKSCDWFVAEVMYLSLVIMTLQLHANCSRIWLAYFSYILHFKALFVFLFLNPIALLSKYDGQYHLFLSWHFYKTFAIWFQGIYLWFSHFISQSFFLNQCKFSSSKSQIKPKSIELKFIEPIKPL